MDVYDGSINEIEELNNMSSGRSPSSVYYSEEEEYYSSDESYSSNVVESPRGKTKLWKPNVPKVFMPDTNARFQSLDEAIKMYSLYAKKTRFDIRLNTTKRFNGKTIKIKYVVCNRNGKIPDKSVDTLDMEGSDRKRRNSNFLITDCKALIKFERQHIGTNVFRIREFQELHNHPLDTKEDRRCSRKARKLDFKDKEFIVRASKANIGPTNTHKLRACLEGGGYEQVGPDMTYYKNFRRNMGNIIGDKDAQIIVDYMNLRKENSENYTFVYKCVNSVLNSMFWCDETDKLYYKEFGDVISFDATFRTNKYGMVFIPFTAIDNHRKSITVGAGLLSNETIESYTWLLESFVKAHGRHPKLVLTDQDPAIKKAVEAVLPDTKHRLCMWHIMKKLQTKVSQDFLINTDFRKRFNKLVWNVYLEPDVFEKNWILLMKEYKLEDKRWFKDMYNQRRSWIPAYFKDVPMHGLMKTTSRSESSNSFFNKFAHHGNLLVYFMMNYDMAIEKQRNNHRGREHATNKTKHEFKMPTGLEHHAANVYTNTIFLEVQKEIYKGAWNCSLENVQMVDGCQIVVITHLDKRMQVKTVCKVELKLPQQEVICSCKLFTRFGILCRHVFAVLKNNRIEKIPDQYILRRWKKDIIDSHLYLRKHGFVEHDDDTSKLVSEAYSNMEYCLDAVKGDKEKLISLVEKSREVKKQLENDASKHTVSDNNEEEVMKLLGINIPNKIDIHVPKGIRNKGCGTKKRIASACEKGSSSSRKKTRICTGCNLYVGHNWRTCKVRIAREESEDQ